jgi:hypothetical protein
LSASDNRYELLHRIRHEIGIKHHPSDHIPQRFILDLIDPFKFADREKLLEAVSVYRINWRDFYSSTDRHGMRFYYPKPEAIGTLEAIGEEADRMDIEHAGKKLSLMDAYRTMLSDLIENLGTDKPHSFTPFEY